MFIEISLVKFLWLARLPASHYHIHKSERALMSVQIFVKCHEPEVGSDSLVIFCFEYIRNSLI